MYSVLGSDTEAETRMAMFVHLAPESRVALIRRNGIRRLRPARGDFPGGVFAVLVMKEPDLASTIVLSVIVGALLIVGGIRARHLAQMIAMGVVGAGILSLLAGYRRARLFSFLHPGHDVGNTGYQLWRSNPQKQLRRQKRGWRPF